MKHLSLTLLLPLFACSGSPVPGTASAPAGSSASVALLRLDRVP